MTNTGVKTSFFTSLAIALAMSTSSMAQTLYTGHYDIEAHYHANALKVALHDHGAETSYELSGPVLPMFQIGFGNAAGTAPAPKQNLTIGDTNLGFVWVNAHSETSADLLNQPFIGFSAADLSASGGWNGAVTFTLKSLLYTGAGSGKLFLFEDETVHWNSTLTSGGNLGSFSVGLGQHGHGEFAFSDEGLYALQMEVSGTRYGALVTSAPGTLKINVVPEPSTGALLMAGLATVAAVRRRTRR